LFEIAWKEIVLPAAALLASPVVSLTCTHFSLISLYEFYTLNLLQ